MNAFRHPQLVTAVAARSSSLRLKTDPGHDEPYWATHLPTYLD